MPLLFIRDRQIHNPATQSFIEYDSHDETEIIAADLRSIYVNQDAYEPHSRKSKAKYLGFLG